MRPCSFRQVISDFAVLAEYWSDKQGITQHVLTVKHFTSRIVREFEQHRTHAWNTFFRCINSCIEQIRHQLALQLSEEACNINCFLVIQPRHTIRGAAMQTAVTRKKTKLQPAFKYMSRGRVLEAADIMAPEAKA
ncbi:hypothetical protein D3C73_1241150 [compost metagenome]